MGTTSSAAKYSKAEPQHLIVLIHGFDGGPKDFDAFKNMLEERAENCTVLVPACNSKLTQTHDGIEAGARRVTKVIVDWLTGHGDVHEISVCGHSLGGLYARYCVKLLHDQHVFASVRPRFFVTFASPHLGVRRPNTTVFNKLWNGVVHRICRTTTELALCDADPVMVRLTEDSFVVALKLFERRILYSNVWNDITVPYCTGAILRRNPYRGTHAEASAECAPEPYGRITRWSMRNRGKCIGADAAKDGEDVGAVASAAVGFGSETDPQRREHLRLIFARLSALPWERFDATHDMAVAHIQIIGKWPTRTRCVLEHCLREVLCMIRTEESFPPSANM